MADVEAMEVEAAEPKAPADKGKGSRSGKRFEIKKWNAVAMWSWAICTDTCAICRNNLYEPSIEYQANPTGDDCLFSTGLPQASCAVTGIARLQRHAPACNVCAQKVDLHRC
jgi:Anaphase-promoting complex subunit 11 RING-H2 finger